MAFASSTINCRRISYRSAAPENVNRRGVEFANATLVLGGRSSGVSALEEVVTGDVDVSFVVNGTNNTYDAAHIMNPSGVGPDTMDVVFDWASVTADDRAQMLGGSFKVALRAPAAATFSSKGADATLQTTFTFDAFE